MPKPPLTYADAGVDIHAADRLVQNIKTFAKRTQRPGVLAGIGGFGALFEIPTGRYQQPVLVSGTDGVGTKLKLAIMMNQHDTIGIDLVAMCVNDIITLGAEPLFFLDYYATGKLNNTQAETIIESIAQGCQLAGTALIGGETAEMPDMYSHADYDLAGFCVGVVEKSRIIDGKDVKAGDAILALASSGPHANGYSLIRKILTQNNISLDTSFHNTTLGQALLTPTRIYAKSLAALLQTISPIHALAHITGGGLLENIPRVLPTHTKAVLDHQTWPMPPIFTWLQQEGQIAWQEMYRTFNCGIGMIIILPQEQATAAQNLLQQHGETVWQVGVVDACDETQPHVIIHH